MNSTKIGIALNQKRKVLNNLCAGVGSKRHLFGWFKSKSADEVRFQIGARSLIGSPAPLEEHQFEICYRKSLKVELLKYL